MLFTTVIKSLIEVFATIGRLSIAMMIDIGRIAVFAVNSLRHCVTTPIYWRLILQQIFVIGYNSLPVVGLTAVFTGMVLAIQIYIGSSRFDADSAVATIVVIGITRELGPVLAGLMVTGRISAAIAAEIGTMRITEQIDALATLAIHPIKYLVVPRLIAAVITLPILVFIADIIGVMGGCIVGVTKLDFNYAIYLKKTVDYLQWADVESGLVKAAVFGFILALMGCYRGFYCRGGAQDVGKATTSAVVSASTLILLANFVITELFFTK